MQRDRRKRHPPARHPVLLRRVLLVAGVQLHDAAATFFCPGHHDLCAGPAAPAVNGKHIPSAPRHPPPHKSILEEKRKIVYYIVL